MYYEVYGNGEPLVLIHGLGLASSRWENQIPVFSQKYQVIVFDNRGVKQTDAPNSPYSTEEMADDTVALLQALNITKAHILGFSMGGMIAQYIAIKYPEIVNSLILISTASKYLARAKHLNQIWLKMMKEQVALEIIIKDVFSWVFTDKFFEDTAQVVTAVNFMLQQPYPQPIHGFAGQVAALWEHDTGDNYAHASRCATLRER